MRGGTLGALAVVGLLTAGTASADPTPSPIAGLINDIATVDENLAQLANDVAIKREHVNKALVDFQNAMAAQQVAAAADEAARTELTKTSTEVEAAQRAFDALMRSVNRQGNNLGSMTDYVSSDDPDQVLERMTSVENAARQQRATVRKLQVVRNQQANRVAATGATKRQTAAAAKGADARRAAAVSAVDEARTAIADQRGKRAELLSQRTALSQKLEKLKGSRTEVAGPSPADALSDTLRKLPSTAVDSDPGAQAAEAIARLALDAGQQVLAGILGELKIPHSQLLDELGIGGTAPLSTGPGSTLSRIGSGSLGSIFGGGGGGIVRPGLRGPQAVELVIDRAKSQLGMPYAWGGGDANGPTLGIRDGGVADAHGDYNKIGFDCSGLMVYAFAGIGVDLPKYTGYQYTSGPQVPLSEMARGDMIFYGPNASQHVAMYLGDGTMIEAPQSGGVVQIAPLRTDGAMPMVIRLT